jgi:mono/diheme cytochrome c family protein
MFKRAITFALAASCAGAIAVGAWAQDAPRGDSANGKSLYLANNCFTCHGHAGQGGAFNGPAPVLARTALPFEAFLFQMRSPSNDMPAYAATLIPDQAAADIFAFAQSLPGPHNAKDIAILND